MAVTDPADLIPALDAIIESGRITITEVEFRSQYLGLFAPRQWDTPAPMVIWTDKVAKTPFNSVDVLDAKGNVLFVVPPILDPHDDVLNPIAQSGKRVMLISNEAQAQADRIPKLGEIHFQQHLTNRIASGKVRREYIDDWNKIFAYYKLPLLSVKAKVATTGAVKSPSLPAAAAQATTFNDPEDHTLSDKYVDL